MKITGIDSFVLTVPTPKPMALNYAQQKLVVAEISTDEGVKGLGYSLVFGGGGAESVHAYLESRLAPVLIGEDPLFVERLWEKMFRTDMGIKKQGVAAYALSALDIGLWDIAGKAAGLPLYKLWGAVTDRISAYGSGGWSKYSEKELIAEAGRYAALGCKYYKMKIHHADPRENAKRVGAVRRALGDGVRMMVDVNQRLDVLANIRHAPKSRAPSRSPLRPARTTTRASSSATSSSAAPRGFSCRTSAAPTASPKRCASAAMRPRTRSRSRRMSCTSCRSRSSARSRTASSLSSSTGRRPTCSSRCRSARRAISAFPTGPDTAWLSPAAPGRSIEARKVLSVRAINS